MAKDKKEDKKEAPVLSKKEAIKAAIEGIEKAYGKGSIMRLGNQPIAKIPVISTGSISLDLALGVMGVPRGRTIEIYGPESSGKTTMSLQIIAEAQKLGGVCAFIDVEHALDLNLAQGIGVDVSELHFTQPDNAEQALETAEMLAAGRFDVVVVDSVSALVPRAEVEGEMGDASIGVQARLMSQAMRKLTSVVAKSGTVMIFINQIRMKIGVMFGNPETTSGGNALKFYASVRLDVRRIAGIKHPDAKKEEDPFIGNRVRVKVVKNKVAPPFRNAELELIFGKGISKELDIVEAAVKYGVIKKAGSWFSYMEQQLAQGVDDTAEFLKKDPVFASSIRSQIIEAVTPKEEEASGENQG